MTDIKVVDLAKVDPRRMTVPIKGSGLDASPSGPWWCDNCIKIGAPSLIRRNTLALLMS